MPELSCWATHTPCTRSGACCVCTRRGQDHHHKKQSIAITDQRLEELEQQMGTVHATENRWTRAGETAREYDGLPNIETVAEGVSVSKAKTRGPAVNGVGAIWRVGWCWRRAKGHARGGGQSGHAVPTVDHHTKMKKQPRKDTGSRTEWSCGTMRSGRHHSALGAPQLSDGGPLGAPQRSACKMCPGSVELQMQAGQATTKAVQAQCALLGEKEPALQPAGHRPSSYGRQGLCLAVRLGQVHYCCCRFTWEAERGSSASMLRGGQRAGG